MNFLSGEELRHHIERGLIDKEDPDALIEDIKFPIRYGGFYEEQTDSETNTTEEHQLIIPPLEHRTLQTEEIINTSYIGKTSPIRIVGHVKPRHSFIRKGVIPGDQGVIDTSWQGDAPLRIQLMNFNYDKALTIEKGQKIGYVYFNYVTTTSELSPDQLMEGQSKRPGSESDIEWEDSKSFLEKRLIDLEDRIENVSALESRVTQLENRLDERLEDLEERTTNLEESHASINEELQDIKNNL
jgi:deoxycytidine triphosphate deaminase